MLARVYSVDSVRLSFTLMRDADAPALAVRAVGLVVSGGWWGPG